jgi:hypothetical protein
MAESELCKVCCYVTQRNLFTYIQLIHIVHIQLRKYGCKILFDSL